MKHSHFVTPRTMADCEFTVGYPKANLSPDKMDRIVGIGMVVCCIATALILLIAR